MTRRLYASVAVAALVAGSAGAQDLMFAPGEGDFNWASFDEYAASHDFTGDTVTLTGPWTGADGDLVNSVLAYFTAATGATINYSGSESFEQDIVISIQAGSAPNIAIFPQPGLAADLAARGALTELADGTGDWILDNYAAGQSWVDLGSFAGPDGDTGLYGFFYKVDLKSLVWYVPEIFEEFGYEVPTTMEELKALTEQVVA